jgi:hypothetical protein
VLSSLRREGVASDISNRTLAQVNAAPGGAVARRLPGRRPPLGQRVGRAVPEALLLAVRAAFRGDSNFHAVGGITTGGRRRTCFQSRGPRGDPSRERDPATVPAGSRYLAVQCPTAQGGYLGLLQGVRHSEQTRLGRRRANQLESNGQRLWSGPIGTASAGKPVTFAARD